ncbi:phosphonopyruvate decarboxylase [Patella vulgata]|uniref:phosphonopyruvate decarboxylase n=1 Tax=Patella vulgata TaxID=6465 RepID=UPI00217FEAB0|nr:phosphonopyruvate decarboxylase [Patella vulgata]XP_050410138.1 phosphonopyruvate decarboxylase [Patella vulgata]
MAAPVFRRIFSLSNSIPKKFEVSVRTKSFYKHNLNGMDSAKLADVKLNPASLYTALDAIDVNYFCGVPDSLLKDFCAFVTDNAPQENHVITANEGNAVGLAAGYHLATGKSAMVYLQNSGLGNMVNPLMSLAAPKVYSIPMLLLVGWRGEPGVKDEPQHVTQGLITNDMLESMRIPYEELPSDETQLMDILERSRKHMQDKKSPFCLLVRSKTFTPYKLTQNKIKLPLTREYALQRVVDLLSESDIIVSTTGMLSRELFEYRVNTGKGHEREFLTVGSMGHASSIALGIALQKPERQIVCLDGDGAALMHLGSMATVGQSNSTNFKHILFNNGAHDSVGGQPTEARNFDSFSFSKIAIGSGYKKTYVATTEEELKHGMKELMMADGPVLLEIRTSTGSRSNLGRPTRTTIENKEDFMDFISQY